MEGKLHKNDNDRWEIVDQTPREAGVLKCELTSGDCCEIKVGEHWIATRIECGWDERTKTSQYYSTVPGTKLYQGQPARISGY